MCACCWLTGQLCNVLIANALQKAVFRVAKDGLLACKTWPFGMRKAVNWISGGGRRSEKKIFSAIFLIILGNYGDIQ
jgi:hypothetical protein